MYEFLKPTRAKLIITLLAFLLIIPFVGYDTGVRCITTPCPSFDYATLWDFMFLKSDNPYAANSYEISWVRAVIGVTTAYAAAIILVGISRKYLGTIARSE